jgi:hypothetical protein
MSGREALAQQLLSAEARAWHDLPPADYDRAVRELFERLSADSDSPEQAAAALALAGAALRRPANDLVESPAACGELMLELSRSRPDADERSRCQLLFLAGWLRLVAVAAQTPESIESSTPLPAGVVLPTGADPSAIEDPTLREEARALARDHRAEAERWNAGQNATDHLRQLAALVAASSSEDRATTRDLALAMSLTPGLPADVRNALPASS